MPSTADDDRRRLLDAAEELFYARGVNAVGMDELRDRSGLSLKRIYACHPSKEAIVVAMLRRRDARWNEGLERWVAMAGNAMGRALAVFDWLEEWTSGPGFRGCAWANVHGELAPTSPAVEEEVRRHKADFHARVAELVGAVDAAQAPAVVLLVEGVLADAGIVGARGQAADARRAAHRLLSGGDQHREAASHGG